MTRVRPFRAGDEAGLADVCLRTGAAGADATGLLPDDAILPAVFVLPYAARHPDFAFVLESDDGRVIGYVVAAPDTDAFEDWFHDEWWPRFESRWTAPDGVDGPGAAILRYAAGRASGVEPHAAAHPAHVHLDLLPEAQGGGWGGRLMEAELHRLREADVAGVHLVSAGTNTGAHAFFSRMGFEPLASPPGNRAFGMDLREA